MVDVLCWKSIQDISISPNSLATPSSGDPKSPLNFGQLCVVSGSPATSGPVLRQKSSIPPAAGAFAVALGRRGAANRWCLKLHQSLWEKVDCASKEIKNSDRKMLLNSADAGFRPDFHIFTNRLVRFPNYV